MVLLLRMAEHAGFDLLLTGDQSVFYQQNNLKRRISLIVLSATKRKMVLASVETVIAAVGRARVGSYEKVEIGRTREMPGDPSKMMTKRKS